MALGITACASPNWVIHEVISTTEIQNGTLIQLQEALSDTFIELLSNYTKEHPEIVGMQTFGIWEACTNLSQSTHEGGDLGCTALYYEHLPACQGAVEIGFVVSQVFIILGIICSALASCCTCVVAFVPKGKLWASACAFAAFSFFIVVFLTYYGTARTIYCEDYSSRLLCDPGCRWGHSFWLCLFAFLLAFVAGVGLCLLPIPQRTKRPVLGDAHQETEEPMTYEWLTQLQMMEDEETNGRPSGDECRMGRYWIWREEEDAWCLLMCHRLAELPSPNLGVEIKIPDDDSRALQVSKVFPDGPASQAGVMPGDIFAVGNGVQLDSMEKFREMLQMSKYTGSVTLDVYRPHPEGGEGAMQWLVVKVNWAMQAAVNAPPWNIPDDERLDTGSESSLWLLSNEIGYVPPVSTPLSEALSETL